MSSSLGIFRQFSCASFFVEKGRREKRRGNEEDGEKLKRSGWPLSTHFLRIRTKGEKRGKEGGKRRRAKRGEKNLEIVFTSFFFEKRKKREEKASVSG